MSSGRLIIPLAEPILNSSGLVEPGTTMTVYITGTTTLASLFADAALATAITNPQTADASGRFYSQATVWWADASQAYDVKLLLPDGEAFTFSQIYVLGAATNISGLAPIDSPVFTGTPQAPTPATNDSSAKLATTQYVQAQGFAPLLSPGFTGTPTAPTASPGTNTTQLATTAFVEAAVSGTSSLTTNGYMQFGGGLLLQWGFVSASLGHGTVSTVTFPIAFPTACLGVTGTLQNQGGANSSPQGLQVNANPTKTSVDMISIGYSSGAFTNCIGFFWWAWGH